MNTSTIRRAAVALVAAAAVVAAAAAPSGGAQGVNPDQLVAHGWTCVVPPPFPERLSCFDPGRGRPFPGNPDPRPTYDAIVFDRTTGELLFTLHLIRGDLYRGQPCGDHDYVFRALIGYWECEHR